MELLVPRRCAGCHAPGEILCAECRRVLASPPRRVEPRVLTHVPVFALGPWSGPHREVVLEMKERGHRAIRPAIGAVVRAAVLTLAARGEIPEDIVLVPAPTSPRHARLRGGDHVTAVCRHSGYPTVQALHHLGVRDSVGLSASERRRNLSGGIALYPCVSCISPEVLLVDDVVTTGATLAASVEALVSAGVKVRAALTLASA
ncbi:ComF family protein [Corynebacterium uropygiale]|uniref:ComF family protein n=1 Tax=Corynebacterium uropygiale TaxID=1775911 RepID=A0A9X1TYP5_9CORY|nr:ComF family protein [Corynebacterium uropygiale]MCF4006066.1 ComF family protein [Corynebacterium uropygiale]